MKQVLVSYRTGELTVADVPSPGVEAGALLLRTSVSLLSAGTEKMALDLGKRSLVGKAQDRPDLVKKVVEKVQRDGMLATAKTVLSKLDEPVPLGYSCAGRVLRVGSGVPGYRPGDRVASAGAKLANHAEVNSVPFRLSTKIPETVSDEAAAFVTVGAIALQGVRTAVPTLGEAIGVIGLGLIGQLTVQILRAAGCKVLGIDLDPAKLEVARACGAHAVLRSGDVSQAVAGISEGRGLDAVIVCAAADSNDPVELAGALCRDRGRVVIVGAVSMNVPRRPYYDKELSLLLSRSYGPGRYDPAFEEQGRDYPLGYVRWTEERNFSAFLELCADKRVEVAPLITHRFSIDHADQAYALLSGASREPYLGIVLTYPTERPVSQTVSLVSTKASPVREPGSEVRLGVAGAGAFASGVLVPAFARLKEVRLKRIVSGRGISARHLGLRFGFAEASTDFAALCRDPTVDAVVLATRHNLHAEQAVAALTAGKHVFVEKPLALTPAELMAVRAAAERSGRILLVGFNRRFAPLALKLREFFQARTAPLVMSYRVNAGPIPPESWIRNPEVGGGRVVGEVCHFIDLLSFLAGALPVKVQASGAVDSAGGADAQLLATLSFADGSIGTIAYASGGDPSYPKERLEVLGSGRLAVLDDFRALELSREGKRRYARSMGQDKGHHAEAEAFTEAVLARGPSPIALSSLMATTAATFAIEAALRSGASELISAFETPA